MRWDGPCIDEAYVREVPIPADPDDEDDDWFRLRRRTSALALLFSILGD